MDCTAPLLEPLNAPAPHVTHVAHHAATVPHGSPGIGHALHHIQHVHSVARHAVHHAVHHAIRVASLGCTKHGSLLAVAGLAATLAAAPILTRPADVPMTGMAQDMAAPIGQDTLSGTGLVSTDTAATDSGSPSGSFGSSQSPMLASNEGTPSSSNSPSTTPGTPSIAPPSVIPPLILPPVGPNSGPKPSSNPVPPSSPPGKPGTPDSIPDTPDKPVTPVPEPASGGLLMAALASAGVLLRARR